MRTSFYAEIVVDITTRNSEGKVIWYDNMLNFTISAPTPNIYIYYEQRVHIFRGIDDNDLLYIYVPVFVIKNKYTFIFFFLHSRQQNIWIVKMQDQLLLLLNYLEHVGFSSLWIHKFKIDSSVINM